MRYILFVLCVSLVHAHAQSISSPALDFASPQTVTIYQLTHPPGKRVQHLVQEAVEKLRHRNVKTAIDLLRAAVAIDRASWDAHVNLGAAYYALKDTQSARIEFETAMNLDPANPLSYADLAVCSFNEGDFGNAESIAAKALRINASSELAQTVLAASKVKLGQRTPEVRRWLERMRFRQPIANALLRNWMAQK